MFRLTGERSVSVMPSCNRIIRACVVASCLAVAGCGKPSNHSTSVEKSIAQPVGEQADTRRPHSDERSKQDEPEAIAKKPEARKPLDLSMPPQPKFDLGALEGRRSSAERLLPDLFEQEKNTGGSPLSLKGNVLMEQTGSEDLDAIEGGQITIEMKTR
jgi:hypothetical protein